MRESSLLLWVPRDQANQRCSIASRRSTAPTSGSIRVAGRDVTKMRGGELAKFRRDQLGFIFQDSNLLDTLTVRENISLALTIQKKPTSEIPPMSTKSRRGWALQRFWSNIPTKSRAAKNNALQQRARSSRSQASFWPMSPQVHSTQNRPNSCSKRFQRSTAWARRSSW